VPLFLRGTQERFDYPMTFLKSFSVVVVFLTLPGTLEIFLVTLGAVIQRFSSFVSTTPAVEESKESIVIVIPAHNEEKQLPALLESLANCNDPVDFSSVCLVADNCTDATAEVGRKAGVRVLERCDALRRGKGYALEFAFETLLQDSYDIFVVIDADSVVGPNFFPCLREAFGRGCTAVQMRYRLNDRDLSAQQRLMTLAFKAFNYIRPMGRQCWGLSSGILGNGFALHRSCLEAVPYHSGALVEDVEYHLKLLASNHRVCFVADAGVVSDIPPSGGATIDQRQRWEGGRLRLFLDNAWSLLYRCLRGQWRCLEPFLDLATLPLSYHAILLTLGAVLASGYVSKVAVIGLVVLVFHGGVALLLGGSVKDDLKALWAIPWYLLWKLGMVCRVLQGARRGHAWVRTERQGAGGDTEGQS